VPEILTPYLEVLRILTNTFADPNERAANTVRVVVLDACARERFLKDLSNWSSGLPV
jgi:hypothetical protein